MHEPTVYALVAALAALGISSAWRWARSRWGMLRLATSGEQYHAVVEQSPNGVLVADATTMRIVAANPALLQLLGFSLQELRTRSIADVFAVAEGQDPKDLLRKLREPNLRAPMQVRMRRKDAHEIDAEVTGNRIEYGEHRAIAFTTHDVSLKRKIEAQLLEKQQHLDHLAHHDQLTGLPNRLFLAAHLPPAIEAAQAKGAMLAVLFLDLDRFKHINDSRGHETGDKLLKIVAQRVRATVRTQDVVVRMGGDEFIVVLHNVKSSDEVNETAGRINESLGEPIIIDGRPLVTTTSIGVSMCPRDGTTIGELLRQSDAAMYQAKDRGRNNFQLFSPSMDRKLKERMSIEASLRSALEQKQLDVHYQPVVEVESNKVVTLEALVRWKHPAHGYISPARFISIAEETGLIMPIGEFVLESVMNDAKRWRAAGSELVPIAVNVSAVQLQRGNLPATIQKLARDRGLKPGMLQIELTESAAFERDSRTGESSEDAIAKLRELGVRIAIDDFGTGYSSLQYLKRWRVDYLKIDRSFVRDLVTDMGDLAIVGAIIAMARHLHIDVVAEGIEGWQQLEKLRQLGCPFAQGFLFAKPAPAVQCDRLLTGEPLNLTGTDVFLDTFEQTGTEG
jgi:diguanylate cyclase (GGDEF)-like protein/PAS domain S-box-containing protein